MAVQGLKLDGLIFGLQRGTGMTLRPDAGASA
jgi:hypothetical protein